MPTPIDFYFDFSSPYGYLASEQIEALAARHGRTVAWRPILLGVVFQQTGGKPLLDIPLKGGYARHDLARAARPLWLTLQLPAHSPFPPLDVSPAFYRRPPPAPAHADSLATSRRGPA